MVELIPLETFEALLGKAEFTALEVARAADVDLDAARRLWQALGFPPVANDGRLFTRSDVEVLRTARELIESQNTDATLVQLTRVIGQSLARVADAQIAAAAERLERLRTTEAPADVALTSLAERIEALVPNLERLLGYVWRRHLLSALLRRSALPGADHVQTVGFADLVGFTALSQALDARELAAMVDRFEAIAYEHIPRRGGRVVKTIGDAVMFAADEGAVAAEIALELVEAHARDAAVPDARAGLASGPTLAWEGDLFGPTVNLASRLVNLARPRTVLVAEELGAQLRDNPRFTLHHLRATRLPSISCDRIGDRRHGVEDEAAAATGDRMRRIVSYEKMLPNSSCLPGRLREGRGYCRVGPCDYCYQPVCSSRCLPARSRLRSAELSQLWISVARYTSATAARAMGPVARGTGSPELS